MLATVVALGTTLGPLTACTGPDPASGPAVAASSSSTATPRPTPVVPPVPVYDAALGAQAAVPATPPPVRLVVPDVGIDMAVDAVGVQEDGQMQIPEDADRAGWYEFGPAPADPAGSTVLAAHVDSRLTGIGPFARLRDVGVGATLTVTTADGSERGYRVVGVEKVPKEGAPVAQWFDRSGAPRLVLVTCGGTFRRDIGHYTDNVVVTAEPLGG
ncbi:class F sortase [Cellulomonas sp. ICMP 17802]|uniref:class F sortase n=1 Tax=Cellulomonas sp. ICMP 17802 TaxID=3239199 RepID=UPI00351B9A5B